MKFASMPAAMRRYQIAIILIAYCAIWMPANGQYSHINSSSSPPAVTQMMGASKMQGQARLRVYGFSIYDAKLWVTEGFSVSNYANSSFALELHYLRNFSGEMIAERSLKEMRRIGQVGDEQAAQWLASMKRTFPDVKRGDQLIGIHRADGSSSFVLNGKPIGEVKDAQFNRLFFGIWLSPKTSEPHMRRELTGIAGGENL